MLVLAKSDLELEKKIRNAEYEINQKSGDDIDAETALVWSARAIAAYRQVSKEPTRVKQIIRFSEAEDFRREALEHAGASGYTATYFKIKRETTKARNSAVRFFEEK